MRVKKKKKKPVFDVLLLYLQSDLWTQRKRSRIAPTGHCAHLGLSSGLPLSGGGSKTCLTVTFTCKTWLHELLPDPESLLRSNLLKPEWFRGLHSAFLWITKWGPSGQTAHQVCYLIWTVFWLPGVDGNSCHIGGWCIDGPWLFQLKVPKVLPLSPVTQRRYLQHRPCTATAFVWCCQMFVSTVALTIFSSTS